MDAVGVKLKDFSAEILGQRVHFHVIKLQKSFFLWVGRQPSLKSLAVAVQTRFVSVKDTNYVQNDGVILCVRIG